MKTSDIAAMWIVAVALIGAVGAHSALPKMPPRLGYGIASFVPGPDFAEPGVAAPIVIARGETSSPSTVERPADAGLVLLVQDITRRMLGCVSTDANV